MRIGFVEDMHEAATCFQFGAKELWRDVHV